MKIINPRPFVPANITTSVTVTETVWSAGSSTIGQRRYVLPDYDLYEAVAVTTDDPVTGAALPVPTWVKVGKVNKFAAFDNILGHPMTGTNLTISIAPDGSVTSGIALFGVYGDNATITVTDPIDGVVYTRTLDLVDNSAVFDWGGYFFTPVILQPDQVLVDLPQYGTATVTVAIGGTAQVGEIVLGNATTLGTTGYGSNVNILDFSRKDRDTFGNAILIQRAYADRVTYDAKVATSAVAWVRRILAGRRALPTVFIGSENHPGTVAFGFFRDFTITLAGPNVSDCTLEIEGLI